MQRRCKYRRKEARVTEAYIRTFVTPRLTERDKKLLRFVHNFRLVTSDQLARVFWPGRSKAQDLCNRRLRLLYDLYCVNRYFPPSTEGSTLQHVTLDRAGARVLGLRHWKPLDGLPITYRHTIHVGEFRILAREYGLGWGRPEYLLGNVRADVYYPDHRMAIEIDTGTEAHRTLRMKAEAYRRVKGLRYLLIITTGPRKRLQTFLDHVGDSVDRPIGARWERVRDLLKTVTEKITVSS